MCILVVFFLPRVWQSGHSILYIHCIYWYSSCTLSTPSVTVWTLYTVCTYVYSSCTLSTMSVTVWTLYTVHMCIIVVLFNSECDSLNIVHCTYVYFSCIFTTPSMTVWTLNFVLCICILVVLFLLRAWQSQHLHQCLHDDWGVPQVKN